MPKPYQPTRRRFLRDAALAATGAMGLSGCGTYVATGVAGVPPPPETLTYWDLLSGADGDIMRQMEANFRERHPEIDLRSVTLTWGNPYYTKLSLATLGDQPPDVAVAHLTRMTNFAKAGLLEPLDQEVLARHGLTADRFSRRAWEQSHVDGELYAVPLDTHVQVLYYNPEICKKAGLLDDDGNLKPLDGPDTFADALARAKEVTGEWGGAMAITRDPAAPWRFFYTLYRQLGGSILADEGRRIVLDDDLTRQVMEYGRKLTIDEEVVPSDIDGGAATALFASGRCGLYWHGDWVITDFAGGETPFSMTRFPNIYGGRYAVQADSHTFVIPKLQANKPGRIDAALTFVRGILDQSLSWAEAGHIPAWTPVVESRKFRQLEPQSNYADVADSVVYDPPAWYSGSGSNFEIIFSTTMASVLAGRSSPDDAIAEIRGRLERLADTDKPL